MVRPSGAMALVAVAVAQALFMQAAEAAVGVSAGALLVASTGEVAEALSLLQSQAAPQVHGGRATVLEPAPSTRVRTGTTSLLALAAGGLQAQRSAAGAAAGTNASAAVAARQRRSRGLLLWLVGHQRSGQLRGSSGDGSVVPTANATCNGSGYFIDWGSSGMKVYRVHRAAAGPGSAPPALAEGRAVEGSLESFKLAGLGVDTPPSEVQAALDELSRHLAGDAGAFDGTGGAAGPRGAVLATGGMRLAPESAEVLWAAVRSWADTHEGFLGRCGRGTDDADCRTIAGSQEARFELTSALSTPSGAQLAASGEPFGFASAGGASAQVGLRGPETELRRCLQDLGHLDAHFDPQRADVVEVDGVPTLAVSFLSVTNLTRRTCVASGGERHCDYDVGGMDQMRARFDEFLEERGAVDNPCLSEYAQPKLSPACDFFGTAACVVDRYGGMISGLPPSPRSLSGPARKKACRQLVQEFMEEDLPLSRWAVSPSCQGLAGGAKRWALLTSFARETQLGADVEHGWEAFRDVREAAAGIDFATEEEVAAGREGVLLSSNLLVHFLEVLGLSPDAEVRGMESEWADAAMQERGLARGWPLPGECSRGLPSAFAPCGLLAAGLPLAASLLRASLL